MKVNPGKGYRLLRKGEVLRKGDEWLCQRTGEWVETLDAGKKYELSFDMTYRRRIAAPRPKRSTNVAASLTVYRVPDMTAKGRKEVCDWLRKTARDLQFHPQSFAKTFRARYMYEPKRSQR